MGHTGVCGGPSARAMSPPPRVPSLIRRLWCLFEARRALVEGSPERALGVLRDPALALSRRADALRQRAMEVLYRDAAHKAAEGRDASVARLLGVAAVEDPVRADQWRRHLGEREPREEGEASTQRTGALRELLGRMRSTAPPPTPTPLPRARLAAGKGGPPRLAPLPEDGATLRFRLAVDDGGDLFVVSGRAPVLGHSRAGVADVPILADLESRHARLTFGESFHGGPLWRIEPLGEATVLVGDAAVEGARTLADGDLVRLAANLAFRFRRPDPSSSSALLELQHGAEAEGAQTVLLFVPGTSGRVRIGPRARRHVPVAGIEHEIDLTLEPASSPRELRVRCAGGVRRSGVDDPAGPAGVETRVPCPPAERVDLVLGARPSQRAPYGLALVPTEPPTMGEGLV